MSITEQNDTQLRLAGLEKRYGDVVAVDHLDMEVRKGEFLTLLGESGSGKSTTLMMIAGFEPPTSGAITLDSEDITSKPAHQRNLGVVFQSYALFPHMTVQENVEYPLRMRNVAKRERRELARHALSRVELEAYSGRRPRELSGGQQQRVALARALVFNPAILLMDEPLGALDRRLREHMQGELRELHRSTSTTIIYVTHDQDEALSLSDRIAVMRNGVVEQIGTPEEIYRSPRNRFVADFIGESFILTGTVVGGTGGLRIRLDGTGEFFVELTGSSAFEEGARVGFMLRPDEIVVQGKRGLASAPVNSVPVEILDQGYYGGQVRLECAHRSSGNRGIVRISALHDRIASRLEVGQEVSISWEASSGRLFALSSEERASGAGMPEERIGA